MQNRERAGVAPGGLTWVKTCGLAPSPPPVGSSTLWLALSCTRVLSGTEGLHIWGQLGFPAWDR